MVDYRHDSVALGIKPFVMEQKRSIPFIVMDDFFVFAADSVIRMRLRPGNVRVDFHNIVTIVAIVRQLRPFRLENLDTPRRLSPALFQFGHLFFRQRDIPVVHNHASAIALFRNAKQHLTTIISICSAFFSL
jgi:hypothetical protein